MENSQEHRWLINDILLNSIIDIIDNDSKLIKHYNITTEDINLIVIFANNLSTSIQNESQLNITNYIYKAFNYYKSVYIHKHIRQQRVQYLINKPQPAQRTPEWYALRNEMLTASDWSNAFTSKQYKGPYGTRNDLILKKCGHEMPFTSNKFTQWGVKYEQTATSLYELFNNKKIIEFGVLQHDTIPFLGASPDGITPDGVMLEIKCPYSREIKPGYVPIYYWTQMQAQLEVCDLEKCDFLECKFYEYDANAYKQDNINYKGCILEYFNENSVLIYYYSPFHIKSSDIRTWRDSLNIPNTYAFKATTFWFLETYSEYPVYRNREWFQLIYPELNTFWNTIIHHREHGVDDILKLKESRKRKPRTKPIYDNEPYNDNTSSTIMPLSDSD
jgi:putative phage-type endonuclease